MNIEIQKIVYLCYMATNKITPEELWARQQISPLDVDYDLWNERRASIQTFSRMSQSWGQRNNLRDFIFKHII